MFTANAAYKWYADDLYAVSTNTFSARKCMYTIATLDKYIGLMLYDGALTSRYQAPFVINLPLSRYRLTVTTWHRDYDEGRRHIMAAQIYKRQHGP